MVFTADLQPPLPDVTPVRTKAGGDDVFEGYVTLPRSNSDIGCRSFRGRKVQDPEVTSGGWAPSRSKPDHMTVTWAGHMTRDGITILREPSLGLRVKVQG